MNPMHVLLPLVMMCSAAQAQQKPERCGVYEDI
jgi:hypothetical protein